MADERTTGNGGFEEERAEATPVAATGGEASGSEAASGAEACAASHAPTVPETPLPVPAVCPPPAPFPYGDPAASAASPSACAGAAGPTAPSPSFPSGGSGYAGAPTAAAGWAPAQPTPPADPVRAAKPESGKAIAALVCGILSILASETVIFGIVLGIVAIVLAGSYLRDWGSDGKATGGRICGIVGLVLSSLTLVAYLVMGAIGMAMIDYVGFDTVQDAVEWALDEGKVGIEIHDDEGVVRIGVFGSDE